MQQLNEAKDTPAQESSPSATPRPWRIWGDLEICGDSPEDNAEIANVYQHGGIREIDEAIANAELIVRAVNSYDFWSELTEAAQAVIERWDAPVGNVTGQEDPEYGAPMTRLRAALAKAKEANQ
jgi:hypothetical protein